MERLKEFILANERPCIRIIKPLPDRANDKILFSRNCQTVEEAVKEFEQGYRSLPAGQYSLSCMKTPNGGSGKLTETFTINGETKKTGTMTLAEIDAIKKEAYESGRKDEMFKQLDYRIGLLEQGRTEDKAKFNKLVEFVSDLKDGSDGDNNKDVLSTIAEVTETLSGAKEMVSDFKL